MYSIPVYILPFLVLWLIIREIVLFVRARDCTEEVIGTVVSLEEHRRYSRYAGGSTFQVHLSYTYNGEFYTGTSQHRFSYDTYGVRQPVRLWVDPMKPNRFLLEEDRAASIRTLVWMGILLVLIGIALVVISQLGM